jgi:hypothetical protein
MGGLFDGGTRQVQQQPIQSALPQSEVTRLSGITGQQQALQQQKKPRPPRTVLGVPTQQVGNASSTAYTG